MHEALLVNRIIHSRLYAIRNERKPIKTFATRNGFEKRFLEEDGILREWYHVRQKQLNVAVWVDRGQTHSLFLWWVQNESIGNAVQLILGGPSHAEMEEGRGLEWVWDDGGGQDDVVGEEEWEGFLPLLRPNPKQNHIKKRTSLPPKPLQIRSKPVDRSPHLH